MSIRNILSKKRETTTETVYDFYWHGVLVGVVNVPFIKDEPVEFITKNIISMSDIRQASRFLYKNYERDISVQHGKKIILLDRNYFEKPVDKKIKERTDNLSEWRIYNAYGRIYIGKILEESFNTVILRIKKSGAFAEDVIHSVNSLLKKYDVVKLTMLYAPEKQATFERDFNSSLINTIIINKIGMPKKCDAGKKIVKQTPVKAVKSKPDDNTKTNYLVNDTKHIDPALLSKTLTVTMNKTQTLESAKQRAQHMANLQYVCIKLLDNNGKFVCNIYPQNVEQIRADKLEQLKQILHRVY